MKKAGIINVSYPEKTYYIYQMYSSDSTDNRRYIGISHNPIQRCKTHSSARLREGYRTMPHYAWMNETIENNINILFEVIEGPLNESEGFSREIEIIQNFKDKGYNVLNISNGGKGASGREPWNKGKSWSLYMKNKLSLAHKGQVSHFKGRKHTPETIARITLDNKLRKERNWQNPRKKPVYKYNLNRDLLVEYPCAKDASLAEGKSSTVISEYCRGKKLGDYHRGFIWTYNKI